MSVRRRILVVDDSALSREALKAALESDGQLEVAGMASSGEESLELAERLKPDLITMDLQMPGMGGLKAIERHVRARPTPIVVISERSSTGAVDLNYEALSRGALELIPKSSLFGASDDGLARFVEHLKLLIEGSHAPAQTPSTGAADGVHGPGGRDPGGGGGPIHRDKPRALFGVDLRAPDAGGGLAVAATWAARLGAVLDVVHVDQERMQVPFVLDSDVRQRLDREWEALRDRDITTLNALLERVPEVVRGHARVEEGDPVEILCDLADEYDLVVVATHGRTGLALLMVGSVAEKLIPRCPRPILVVRSS